MWTDQINGQHNKHLKGRIHLTCSFIFTYFLCMFIAVLAAARVNPSMTSLPTRNGVISVLYSHPHHEILSCCMPSKCCKRMIYILKLKMMYGMGACYGFYSSSIPARQRCLHCEAQHHCHITQVKPSRMYKDVNVISNNLYLYPYV